MKQRAGPKPNFIFRFPYSFPYLKAFKMTQIINRYWWGHLCKIAKTVYQPYLTCQSHNPGKLFLSREASDLLPRDPLNACSWTSFDYHWYMGYQYVLVTKCMFSRCAEGLPCHKADVLTMAKKLLERKCVSHLGYTLL